jgi:hypothetical protein
MHRFILHSFQLKVAASASCAMKIRIDGERLQKLFTLLAGEFAEPKQL